MYPPLPNIVFQHHMNVMIRGDFMCVNGTTFLATLSKKMLFGTIKRLMEEINIILFKGLKKVILLHKK